MPNSESVPQTPTREATPGHDAPIADKRDHDSGADSATSTKPAHKIPKIEQLPEDFPISDSDDETEAQAQGR